MGELHLVGRCRGEGVGYLAVCASEYIAGVCADASLADGTPIPCEALRIESPRELRMLDANACSGWVVVVPLLGRSCLITLSADGEVLGRFVFPPLLSKLSSRLMGSTRPELAALLRGFEQRRGAGRTRVWLRDVWPADEGKVVWRAVAEYVDATGEDEPTLVVRDQMACEVEARTIVMEDQMVPYWRDEARTLRLVTFSCAMPEGLGSFYIEAMLGGRICGFAGMNAPRAAGMLADRRRLIVGPEYDGGYEGWFDLRRATDAELAWQRRNVAEDSPFLGVVLCGGQDSEPRGVTLASLRAQSYGRWKLASEAVGDAGRFDCMLFVEAGCVLEPDALWHLVRTMVAHPDCELAFCDEDCLDGASVRAPRFRTFANYGSLYTHNALGRLLLMSRVVWERAMDMGPLVEGAEAYDMALRAFELASQTQHVARVLYHVSALMRETNAAAHEAGKRALATHLERRGIAATVDDGPESGTYRVRYELPVPLPKVSIVIPTRDHSDLLRACVESILDLSTYGNYEVILVENNSVEQRTFALYEELRERDGRVCVVTWEPDEPGAFNYSAIVNFGVRHATGELVVLLNNDTEVIESTWLEEMAGCLMRPEVGVVGAKLLFYDGLIQHVGMVANPNGDNCHVYQNLTRTERGAQGAAVMPGDYSMVTGACQMTSRALFDELGGYDERLAVGFNDSDYCLRAGEAGYAVTMAAHALLYHREFSTRGREVTDVRLRARFLRERAYMMGKHAEFYAKGDPALSPNVNPFGSYGEL